MQLQGAGLKHFLGEISTFCQANQANETVKAFIGPLAVSAKAWGDLLQQQAQASQSAVAETFEAFKNVKEPQAAMEIMGTFAQTLLQLTSKNMKDTVALSVSQFKGNVSSLEKTLPASEAVTSIANSMKDSASQMESTVESSVNEGVAAAKKARFA